MNSLSRIWVTVLAAAGVCAAGPQTDAVKFQAGIEKEVVAGDMAGAMQIYEALSRSSDRGLAGKAMLRLARCHEKLGDGQAAALYERIVKEFADRPEVTAAAAERLDALAPVKPDAGAVVAWYTGDWQSGIPGLANWYIAQDESQRVYDEFVVPEGGWTITGLFSNNRMDFAGVTHAAWEIRSGLEPGGSGRRVAGGLAKAMQKAIPGNGPFPRDPLVGYRIEVSGLRVRLAPGHYWFSVAPVGMGVAFASATRGRNAVGSVPAVDGRAYFRTGTPDGFQAVEDIGAEGQMGRTRHFSMGVLVERGK